MRDMLSLDLPEAMRGTGTDDATVEPPKLAQRMAQRAGRDTGQIGAKECDRRTKPHAQKKTPKPLQIVDLGDEVQGDATLLTSSGGGIRTPDTRIMIPLL